MEMLNAVQITFFEEVRRKKTIIEVANDYFERAKPKPILFEVKEEVKLVITKSIEELKEDVKEFIYKEVADLQEEGSACLIHCEKSGDFHMTSYWIDGTYLNVDSFLKENYTEELGDIVLEMYPNDLSKLEDRYETRNAKGL